MQRSEVVLELFCGIGGLAAALDTRGGAAPQRVTAVDIDRAALEVHRQNFPQHHRIVAELASFDARAFAADFWWLSPPCLPFTRKGTQRDASDRRTESLLQLIRQIQADHPRPTALAIENVPPFAQSQTAAWVVKHLQQAGFETAWEIRCPTELGWPVRRRRAYLLASRRGLQDLAPPAIESRSLAELLDRPDPANSPQAEPFCVPEAWLEQYAAAIDVLDPTQSDSLASCFTSSYGRSPVRSGSYLKCDRSPVRFFTPSEILRCLGYPPEFTWPETISLRRRWQLAGNSLSLPVVNWILSRLSFPEDAIAAAHRSPGDCGDAREQAKHRGEP